MESKPRKRAGETVFLQVNRMYFPFSYRYRYSEPGTHGTRSFTLD